jgi:Domain of unknown function (DUF4123)
MATASVSTMRASLDQTRGLAQAGCLYAVVDACDEPEVSSKVRELGPGRAVSLYRGGAEEDYADVAPYLVCADPATLQWITDVLWSRPWGILIYAETPLEALRTHLRHFLKVRSNQKTYFFRFYDPRVLPGFLESSNRAEIRQFFGPVQAFGVSEQQTVLFYRDGGGASG